MSISLRSMLTFGCWAVCSVATITAIVPTAHAAPSAAYSESKNGVNLGTLGTTYEIKEPDFLDDIQTILLEKQASGELDNYQKKAIAQATQSIKVPAPVQGLGRTIVNKTRYWDPTVTVQESITDEKGHVVVPKGTRRNPLDVITWHKSMLFFDGNDPDQRALALKAIQQLGQKVTPVLVAGPAIDLMEKWKTRLFFDQKGLLVKRFGIKQVPAWVYQEGKQIRIDEVIAPQSEGAQK